MIAWFSRCLPGRRIRWSVSMAAVFALGAISGRALGQIRFEADEAVAQPLPAVDEDVVPASFVRAAPDDEGGPQPAATSAGIAAVQQSGILARARTIGGKAVDFELEDAAGYRIKASELWAVGPLVVVHYRGGWSPICNAHLKELQKSLRDIHGQGGQLVAISPESAEHALATQLRNKLTFPLLVDKGSSVARQFGIVYRAADGELPLSEASLGARDTGAGGNYELPLAATYVIDTGGTIRYAFLDADSSHRARPQKVVEVLRRLQQGIAASPVARPGRNERTELR